MGTRPPQSIIDAIEAGVTQVTRRVAVYETDAKTVWNPDPIDDPDFARLIDGTVSLDYTSDERRKVDLTMFNEDGALRLNPRGGFYYDKVIKVFRGVKYSPYRTVPPIALADFDGTYDDKAALIRQVGALGYELVDMTASTDDNDFNNYPITMVATYGRATTRSALLKSIFASGRHVVTVGAFGTSADIPFISTVNTSGLAYKNFVRNPSGETGVTDYAAQHGTVTAYTRPGLFGSIARGATRTQAGAGDNRFANNVNVSLDATRLVYASVWVWLENTRNIQLEAARVLNTGTASYVNSGYRFVSANVWTRIKFVVDLTGYNRINQMQIVSLNNNNNETIFADGWMLSNYDDDYFDGDTVNTPDYTTAWDGTPHFSLSTKTSFTREYGISRADGDNPLGSSLPSPVSVGTGRGNRVIGLTAWGQPVAVWPANVGVDSSFESGSDSLNPGTFVPSGRFAWDTTVKHSGSRSLRSDAGSFAASTLFKPVNVLPGQTWRYGIWYKTTADYNGTINNGKLRLGNQASTLLQAPVITLSTDWVKLVGNYTVPPSGVSQLQLSLVSDHTTGTVWADDYELTNVTDQVDHVSAAIGTSGTSGKWFDLHLPSIADPAVQKLLKGGFDYMRGSLASQLLWEYQLGEFMIDGINDQSFPNTIKVTGRDYTKKLLTDKLAQATTFRSGTSLRDLITGVAAGAGVVKLRLAVQSETLPSDTSYDRGTDRWSIIKAAATSFGYEVFFDNEGYLVVRTILDPYLSPISHTFLTGEVGNLIDYSRSVNDSRIYNIVNVYGDPADNNSGQLPYFGQAINDDPNSPTSTVRIGNRPTSFASVFFTSNDQCYLTARKMLAVSALESYEANFSSLYYPWLEVGEIAEILDPDAIATDPTRFLMDTLSLPLGLAPMTGTAKRVTVVGTAGTPS